MEIYDLYKIIDWENHDSEIISMSMVVKDINSGKLTAYTVNSSGVLDSYNITTNDSAETATNASEAGQGKFDPAMAAMAASFELDKPRKASWKDSAVRTIDRLISWMIYSITFCFLFGVAGLDLSAREIIAYSLMLGLVVGSINNIERVMRELFKKED